MNTPEENRQRIKRLRAEEEVVAYARRLLALQEAHEMFDRIAAFLGVQRNPQSDLSWSLGDYWDPQERKMKRLPRQYLLPEAKIQWSHFDPRITSERTPGIASARRHDRGRNRIERRG
ncbi:MAG: hypothetical protein ACJ788_01920 [Ktedonobacteraceae bacterium]